MCATFAMNAAISQPVNDFCSNATMLSIQEANSCVYQTFNNLNATHENPQPACDSEDIASVWFLVTDIEGVGSLIFNLQNLSTDWLVLDIFTDCSGSYASELSSHCISSGTGINLTVTGVVQGRYYYVRVGNLPSLGDTQGDFNICVTKPDQAPTNDDCANAISISEGVPADYNTEAATESGPTITGANDIFHDIWYVFNPTKDSTYQASTCASNFDTKIAVYEASTCNAIVDFSEIAYNDDDPQCVANDLSSTTTFIGNAGSTYYIRVGGFSSGDNGNGVVEVSFTEQLTPTTNDVCEDAISLSVNADLGSCTPQVLSVYQATSTDGGALCNPNGGYVDVWFKFNTGSYNTIWPRLYESNLNEVASGGMGELFTFYTDCSTVDSVTSNQCSEDTISGFEKNTDYWFKLSFPQDWEDYDIELCLLGFDYVGIEENISAAAFSISPNPASNQAYLKFESSAQRNIEIYDLTGRLYQSDIAINDSHMLDLTRFAQGVYIVKVQSGNSVKSERLIVH